MPLPLRVLIFSDNERDAQQLIDVLRQSDYVPTYHRVATRSDFRDALAQKWDLVLAEYASGELRAMAALDILHETGADIPFVAISDPVPEESVLEVLKAGASGHITREHLSRLGATVAREMCPAAPAFRTPSTDSSGTGPEMASNGMSAPLSRRISSTANVPRRALSCVARIRSHLCVSAWRSLAAVATRSKEGT